LSTLVNETVASVVHNDALANLSIFDQIVDFFALQNPYHFYVHGFSFIPIVYRLHIILPTLLKIYDHHKNNMWWLDQAKWWNTHFTWIIVLAWKIPGGKKLMWSVFSGFVVPIFLLNHSLVDPASDFGWASWSLTPYWCRSVFLFFLAGFFIWDYGLILNTRQALLDLDKALLFFGKHRKLIAFGQSVTEKLAFSVEKAKSGGMGSRLKGWVAHKVIKAGNKAVLAKGNDLLGEGASPMEVVLTVFAKQFLPIIVLRILVFFDTPYWWLYTFCFLAVTIGLILIVWYQAASYDYVNPPTVELFKQIWESVDIDEARLMAKSITQDAIDISKERGKQIVEDGKQIVEEGKSMIQQGATIVKDREKHKAKLAEGAGQMMKFVGVKEEDLEEDEEPSKQ